MDEVAPAISVTTTFGWVGAPNLACQLWLTACRVDRPEDSGDYVYQRAEAPTRIRAEAVLGALEGGHAVLYSSGFAQTLCPSTCRDALSPIKHQPTGSTAQVWQQCILPSSTIRYLNLGPSLSCPTTTILGHDCAFRSATAHLHRRRLPWDPSGHRDAQAAKHVA